MSDPMPKSAPTLQPFADTAEAQNFHLWRDASGWRTLVLSAVGLSAALVAFPLIATPPDDASAKDVASCHGNAAAFAGPSGQGKVVGFLSPDQAVRLLQNTQFSSRIAINPDYLANVRTVVHMDGSLEGSRTIYLMPKGMNVRPGDHVDVVGGRIDPSLPCHYIPNLIVRIQP